MKVGTEKGRILRAADKRAIRAEVVEAARRTGERAYTFRFDGDDKVEFRAWPNGKTTVQRVSPLNDISQEPPRRVTAAGVSARAATAGGVGLLVLADVLSRVLL